MRRAPLDQIDSASGKPEISVMLLRGFMLCLVAGQLLGAALNEPASVRGADELFWTPTLEQALQMAKATGRPIFMMGYSLVDERSTYTRLGPEYCSAVF